MLNVPDKDRSISLPTGHDSIELVIALPDPSSPTSPTEEFVLNICAKNVETTDAVIPDPSSSQIDMCRSPSFNAVFPLSRCLFFVM